MPMYLEESALTEAVFAPDIVCVMISSLKKVMNPTSWTVRVLCSLDSVPISRLRFFCGFRSKLVPGSPVTGLRKSRDFRLKKDQNDVRLEMVKVITEILVTEEKVDRAARAKVKTIKREIAEGGEEYDLLHRRYYAEELKKLGIDLAG